MKALMLQEVRLFGVKIKKGEHVVSVINEVRPNKLLHLTHTATLVFLCVAGAPFLHKNALRSMYR